jgi:thiol-disulfide isomerase/thioredoxin
MNKTTGIIIGALAVVAIGGIAYSSMGTKDSMMNKEMSETMMKDDMAMMDPNGMEKGDMKMMDDTAMVKDDMKMMDDGAESDTAMMKGSYEAYSPEKISRAESGDVVLFFHASWCPSCRSLSKNIEENMTAIPDGVSILKVDYDKESDLKKKYEVTNQHTLVQVDANGNLIKKWSGSSKLMNLVAEIQ